MAKYTFLNMPAWGHVNPTLAVAQELVRRGHDVSYYLTEEFRETVEATGAVFQPYESKLSNQLNKGMNAFNGPGGFMAGGRGPTTVVLEEKDYVPPQVIDRIRAEQPDAIIYDFMCSWAIVVKEALQVPGIAMRATYASNEQFKLFEHIGASMRKMPGAQEFMQRMRAYREANPTSAVSPLQELFKMFASVEQLNIIFMPRVFQPMVETFDERYVFVGPSILPRHQRTDFPFDQLDAERPLLYISLGSLATNQPEFYTHCFAAFGEQPWQVVLSVGKHIDVAQLGPVPTNFLLSPYVPQLDILPRAQVFVTHAGTNSVMESLYYGVPMVLIPQQPEQYLHAQRSIELGLGTLLEKSAVTAATLRESVERVAHNPEYRERAQQMQPVVREAGGYQRAADAIVQFTRTHAQKL